MMICPTTPDGWRAIADKLNFPHTGGALGEKHVACRCPPNTGSMYYNYKVFYSVVLMALVDADSCDLYIAVMEVAFSSTI